jgi:hypothetical protein
MTLVERFSSSPIMLTLTSVEALLDLVLVILRRQLRTTIEQLRFNPIMLMPTTVAGARD